MGGLGPGIGGLEILVIGLLALIVVGPKDLPLLMRKVGRAVGKARAMANEFRSSFDEMARQSELDELRKEVEALRTGQAMVPLGAEAEAAFREISADLNQPLDTSAPVLPGPEEWPDNPPTMTPLAPAVETPATDGPARAPRKARAKAIAASGAKKGAGVKAAGASSAAATPTVKPRATTRKPSSRKKAPEL
jgi:sec-independent protein translocase protein TatB